MTWIWFDHYREWLLDYVADNVAEEERKIIQQMMTVLQQKTRTLTKWFLNQNNSFLLPLQPSHAKREAHRATKSESIFFKFQHKECNIKSRADHYASNGYEWEILSFILIDRLCLTDWTSMKKKHDIRCAWMILKKHFDINTLVMLLCINYLYSLA